MKSPLRFIFSLAALTMLTSCVSITLNSGDQNTVAHKIGDFHVAQFLVVPSPSMKSDSSNPQAAPDFISYLQSHLAEKLRGHTTGRSVDLIITVLLSPNLTKQVATTIDIQDTQTHAALNSLSIDMKQEWDRKNFVTAIHQAIDTDTANAANKDERDRFMEAYMNHLIGGLYNP